MLNPLKGTWEWKLQGSKLKKFGKYDFLGKEYKQKRNKGDKVVTKKDWEMALMQEKKKNCNSVE